MKGIQVMVICNSNEIEVLKDKIKKLRPMVISGKAYHYYISVKPRKFYKLLQELEDFGKKPYDVIYY